MSSFTGMFHSQVTIGTLLTAVGLSLFAWCYREVRRRPHAWWTGETAVSSVIGPLITTLIAFGVASAGFGVADWAGSPPALPGLLISVAALAGAIALTAAVVSRTPFGMEEPQAELRAVTTAPGEPPTLVAPAADATAMPGPPAPDMPRAA